MNALDFWTGQTPDRLLGSWDNVAKEFDRMLNDVGGNKLQHGGHLACDIEENQSNFLMSFDLPGFKKEDVNIEVDGKTLTVTAERKRETKSNDGGIHRSERHFGRYERRFQLPEGIDSDAVEAQYEDGVLTLALPKTELTKAKKITIAEGKKGFLRKLKEKPEAKES